MKISEIFIVLKLLLHGYKVVILQWKSIYRRSENHLKFYSKNSFDKPLIENHSCGPVTKPSSDIEYQADLKYLKKYKVIADLSKFIISESIKTEFKPEYYYITPKFKQVIKSSNPY